MNLIDHPLALDMSKRISDSDEGCIPAQVFFPGMSPMAGSLTLADHRTPGVFCLTAMVTVNEKKGEAQAMRFLFTADKPTCVHFPELPPEESRIIS